MTQEEFKSYQRTLNRIRESKLKESPLPTAKQLLEPDVTFKVDISDLTLENIPINIKGPVQPTHKDEPIKSESKSLF